MPDKYLVNSSDLTSVADIIRSKLGYSGTLQFPNGFTSKINELLGKKYIFKEGTGAVSEMSITKQANCTATVGTSDISIVRTNEIISCAVVMTTNAIDLSSYNVLFFESKFTLLDSSSNYRPLIGAFSSRPDAGTVSTTNAKAYSFINSADSVRKYYMVNVSNLTGNYYIGIVGAGSSITYNIYLI